MLRVECENCKTPSQVDERKVPRTGLTMRCPKCGHNYLVEGKAAAAKLRRAGTSTLIFGTLEELGLPKAAVVVAPLAPPPVAPVPSVPPDAPGDALPEVGSLDRGWFDDDGTSADVEAVVEAKAPQPAPEAHGDSPDADPVVEIVEEKELRPLEKVRAETSRAEEPRGEELRVEDPRIEEPRIVAPVEPAKVDKVEPAPERQSEPVRTFALAHAPEPVREHEQARWGEEDSSSWGTRKRSKVAPLVIVLAVLGGGALEMTPYGAFGRIIVGDKLHADEYARLAVEASDRARAKMLADVYPDTMNALDELARIQAEVPRAKALAAYRAVFALDAQLRFGIAAASGVDKAKSLVTSAGAEEGLFLQGEVALATKNAAAAIDVFGHALAKRPSARAHFGLARAHFAAGRFDVAGKEVEETLAASPRHAGARVLRASIAWQDGRNEAAMEDLSAIFDGPAKEAAAPKELAEAWALGGFIEAVWGRTGEARTAFEQALKLDPRCADAFIGQGELSFADGRYADALASFDKALELVPSHVEAIADDAKAKLFLSRAKEAKAQLVLAQREHPKDFRIVYWLAKSDEALDDPQTAEQEYGQAIALVDAKRREAALPYAGLVEWLASSGRDNEAQAKLEEAKGKLADAAPVQRALGEGYWRRGLQERKSAPADALADFKRAVESDPARAEIYADLADAYEAKKDSQNAYLSWQKALKSNENHPYWRYRYGRLLLERGTVADAAKHLVFAVGEAKNTHPPPEWLVPAEFSCAQALQRAGKFADAIEHYRAYLAQSPKTAPERQEALAALAEMGASPK